MVLLRLRSLVCCIALLVLAACGGSADSGAAPSQEGGDGETINAEDGKFDAATELKVRAQAITVWVDTQLTWRDGSERWVLSGRASKDLADASAYLHARPVAGASVISARKFELLLSNEDLLEVLSGQRLFVDLLAGAGSVPKYSLSVRLRARIENTSGSSKIYLHKNIVPVLLDGAVVYRGRATVDLGYGALTATNDDDSEPIATQEDERHWRMDWQYGSLVWAASPPEDGLSFSVEDAGGMRVSRRGEIHIKLRELGITVLDPFEVWPPLTCESEVAECLAQLTDGDTESCGEAAAVGVCEPAAPAVDAQRFATDLKAHLVEYYAAHGSDIAAMGGSDLAAAQAAVSASSVSVLTDPDEDPFAHDFSTTTVLSHPDVVFPGSDIVWFGAYDTAGGQLLEVYDFN